MTDNADWDVARDVGFTALLVAACRAIEAHREHEPLVRDTLWPDEDDYDPGAPGGL